jgi:transcriptional regulator with XRE-family HTH domain
MTKLGIIIGNNLKKLRGEVSQSDFAESLEVGFRSYQRYESGERMAPDELIKRVAVKFNLPLTDIISPSEVEGDVIQFKSPFSRLIKGLSAIPDNVYEIAQELDLDDDAWKSVYATLKYARDKKLGFLDKT